MLEDDAAIEHLGTLQVDERLAILDPGYLRHVRPDSTDDELAARVAGLLETHGAAVSLPTGRYEGLAEHLYEGDAVGPQIGSVLVRATGGASDPVVGEQRAGSVLVDSGYVDIFDVADGAKIAWSTDDYALGRRGPALLSLTGEGDGSYPVVLQRRESGARSLLIDLSLEVEGEQGA